MNRQKMIREMYEVMMDSIVKNYPHTDSNFFDWTEIMSIAERLMWSEIKGYGLPMYPQFPVLGYFIDFADPVKKVAIEVDGAQFHKDFEKDMERQREIEAHGWTFYRISGKEVQPFFPEFDEDVDPVETFILRIKNNHYKQ